MGWTNERVCAVGYSRVERITATLLIGARWITRAVDSSDDVVLEEETSESRALTSCLMVAVVLKLFLSFFTAIFPR